MDASTLAKAMDYRVSDDRYAALTPAWNAALIAAGCTTIDRVAMWCSQIGHESGGLKWMQEIADGSDYEWRQDLGNTQPGDGRRFKGHGPIQITGRHNHTKVSEWAFSKGFVDSPDFFVRNPDALADDRFGFLGAVWYWTAARDMNSYADRRDLLGATKAVNGGTNGLDDRRGFYDRALALGSALLPSRGETVSFADDELSKKFPSRSKYRAHNDPVDTLAGFVLFIDAALHEMRVEAAARNGDPAAVALVKREADKGDQGAQAVLAKLN